MQVFFQEQPPRGELPQRVAQLSRVDLAVAREAAGLADDGAAIELLRRSAEGFRTSAQLEPKQPTAMGRPASLPDSMMSFSPALPRRGGRWQELSGA